MQRKSGVTDLNSSEDYAKQSQQEANRREIVITIGRIPHTHDDGDERQIGAC